jgi:hypothetical protein
MGSVSAQSLHYEGGLSVSSGNYIYTERTTSWVFTNGLALGAGPFTIRAMLPVFRQNSVLVTVSSAGPIPVDGSGTTGGTDPNSDGSGGGRGMPQIVGNYSLTAPSESLTVDSGELSTAVSGYELAVGDPSASLNLSVYQGGSLGISMNVGAKAPVTGITGFGTGQWDFGGSVSLSHRIGFSGLAALDVGYWHLGDLADLDLRDPVLASLSLTRLSMGGWALGVMASAATAIVEGYPNGYQIGASVSRVGRGGTFGVNLAVGLTETTPDLSVGLNWRIGLTRPRW